MVISTRPYLVARHIYNWVFAVRTFLLTRGEICLITADITKEFLRGHYIAMVI